MDDIINYAGALLTIAFGIVGWLAPRYTMGKLDLKTDGDSSMGVSEIRAASGALFVGLGIGAFLVGEPAGFAMIGFASLGAAVGRLTSIIADPNSPKAAWGFFAYEVVLGAALLWVNLL